MSTRSTSTQKAPRLAPRGFSRSEGSDARLSFMKVGPRRLLPRAYWSMRLRPFFLRRALRFFVAFLAAFFLVAFFAAFFFLLTAMYASSFSFLLLSTTQAERRRAWVKTPKMLNVQNYSEPTSRESTKTRTKNARAHVDESSMHPSRRSRNLSPTASTLLETHVGRGTAHACRVPLRCATAVVFRGALAARERAGLDLSGVHRDREIGDRRVLGLAGAMRHRQWCSPPGALCDTASKVSVRVPIWFTLTRIELAMPPVDAALQPLGVGDEEIVADQLNLVPSRTVRCCQPVPIVLSQPVFDRNNRIVPAPASRRTRPSAAARGRLAARLVEVHRRLRCRTRSRRSRAPSETSLTGAIAGLADRLEDGARCAASLLARFGAKPPSSPTLVPSPVLQHASSAGGRSRRPRAAPR